MAFYGTTLSPEILAADIGIAGSGELEIIKSCSYMPAAGAKPINLHFKPVLGAARCGGQKGEEEPHSRERIRVDNYWRLHNVGHYFANFSLESSTIAIQKGR